LNHIHTPDEKKERGTMSETEAIISAAAEKYRNRGRWGAGDQLGTLNYITPAKIAEAGRLARQGKVFSLALPLDQRGPQNGSLNRFNPVHAMLADGGDWAAGARPFGNGIGGADDLMTPTHMSGNIYFESIRCDKMGQLVLQ
jgi:hypothetical protein